MPSSFAQPILSSGWRFSCHMFLLLAVVSVSKHLQGNSSAHQCSHCQKGEKRKNHNNSVGKIIIVKYELDTITTHHNTSTLDWCAIEFLASSISPI